MDPLPAHSIGCDFVRSACRCVVVLICIVLFPWLPARAKVVRIVIDKAKSSSPAYGGQSFGSVGQYEKIVGKAYGQIDPNDRRNSIIQDVRLAPRNSRGMVEYVASFTLVKPVDMSKANGVLLYDVVNRGNRQSIQVFNGGEPGDGFLMKQGIVILASAWQGDIFPSGANDIRETLQVPIARNPDGSSVTGPVIAQFTNIAAGTNTISLAADGYQSLAYQRPLSLDASQATLTSRASQTTGGQSSPITTISPNDWAFADCSKTAFPGTPDPSKICLRSGFDPLLLYQIVFRAKDPLVLGIGLAATRDVVSFFRHEVQGSGGDANPLGTSIRYVVAQGTSQSGNLVKSFVHLGFNEDESGRVVWDGANDHIAGRQTPLNLRFASPGGAAEMYQPGSEPVLWWSDWPDKVRDRKEAGMSDRCTATQTCPKIFETFGSTEFWGLRMSPDLVGTSADKDIPLPANVRRYYFPGTTHGGGRGGFSTSAVLDLIGWVVRGTAPPASRYPTLADKILVVPTKSAMNFPTIPGLTFTDSFENPVLDYDFGSTFIYNDLSGVISNEPPAIKQVIKMLVPKVNADGNEVGGVPSILFQAPLGTYLGWNITSDGFFKGQICGFSGGYVPFAKTKAERQASGDPRLSLEERYASHDDYVALVKSATQKAVAERFLSQEDADLIISQAQASDVATHK
jgi:Alpha/beta hydrolase domain